MRDGELGQGYRGIMNDRKSFDIEETRRFVYERDDWRCQHPGCFRPPTELAHGISKGLMGQRSIQTGFRELYNIDLTKKQAEEVVNYPENMTASCPEHNDYFAIHPSQKMAFESRLKILYLKFISNNK